METFLISSSLNCMVIMAGGECFSSHLGYESILLMAFHVESQMIGSREATFAVATFEGFGSGMFPKMSGQLI